MKIIEVLVGPKGEIKLETKGFAGAECEQASKELVAALGRVVSDQKTGEHFSAAVTTLVAPLTQ